MQSQGKWNTWVYGARLEWELLGWREIGTWIFASGSHKSRSESEYTYAAISQEE